MTNIFIDIPSLLKHRSQIVKCVFLEYLLTIKSNISSSYVVALKSHFMKQSQKKELHNHMKQICHKPFKSAKLSCPKQDHIKFLFAKLKFV
jgi:hypothetical protein